MAEDLLCRAELQELALAHHGDGVGQNERLLLIVCDEDHRGAELALQALELPAHPHAQRRVEVRERLVKQAELWLDDERAGECHALLLAARELADARVLALGKANETQVPAALFLCLRAGIAVEFEPVGHVLQHAHVREQTVGLEDSRNRPLLGRERGDVMPVEEHSAAVGLEKAADHVERGRLAAARRAENAQKSALFQAEGEVMHGVFAVKLLAQAVKFEIHGDFLLSG